MMGLFKSRDERRLERDVEIRRGIKRIRRAIREAEKNEVEFLEKAKRAKKVNDRKMLDLLYANVNRARAMKVTMERQLLSIETARQIKDQAETHAAFAKTLWDIAKSIGSAYGEASPGQTVRRFEVAMDKAESLGEQMDVFLKHTADVTEKVGEADADESEFLLGREEFEKMLEDEVVSEEEREFESEIDDEIAEIEQRLKAESETDEGAGG
jgi:arginyl-tRNA--protein-N-Asp/Glu arginylyltransferase